jgi:signal transduction protein with GAF and PtsI domain
VIKFLMPLTTTIAELDEGIDILERALEAVSQQARPTTHRASTANLVAV